MTPPHPAQGRPRVVADDERAAHDALELLDQLTLHAGYEVTAIADADVSIEGLLKLTHPAGARMSKKD